MDDKLVAALARGDWARAEAGLRRLAAKPDAPGAVFYNLAKVLVAAGRGEMAGVWFRRAVARAPGHADAWFELGSWALGEGGLAEAAAAYASAARLRPTDADAWRNLGRVALRIGDYAAARGAFMALDGLVPGDGEALLGRYQAAAELRLDEAAALRAALAARPDLAPQRWTALTRVSCGRLPMRVRN